MRTKTLPAVILALAMTLCVGQVKAVDLISSVDRTGGISGNRPPIGAYNSETDPLPSDGPLADGLYCFSDRTYIWVNMEPEMAGLEYVRTFNSDKSAPTVVYSVTISGPAVFWITMDDRFADLQSLVDQAVSPFAASGTFTDTGYDLFIGGDSDRRLSVFMSSQTSVAGTYDFIYAAGGNNFYVMGVAPPAGNQPPTVDAGPDAEITMPVNTVTLNGTVADDGLGEPDGYLVRQWSKVSGPGDVEFLPSDSIEDPTAVFQMNQYGDYVLQIYASDGQFDGSDTVTVTVNAPDCPVGDINGDCVISQLDYSLFALEWLDDSGGVADFTGDGEVDFSDFFWIAGNWLESNQSGSLHVTLEPNDVHGAGALWRVNGGLWHDSGDVEAGLAIGTATVEYSEIDDWYTPADQQVEIVYGQLTQTTGTYTPHTGSLRVDISPVEVLPDARWRRLGQSTWLDSGTTEMNVPVGPHTVEFAPVIGWLTPARRDAVVPRDDLVTLAVEYTELGDLTLRINEFMAGNSSVTGITDEYGDSDDWIEIYNATDFDIDLGGLYIKDSGMDDPWRIPTTDPAQTTVLSKGYIVLWADDEEETEGPLHLPFKLGMDSDTITLYESDGLTVVDSISYGSQIWNVSYGRYPDASNDWYFFDDPSFAGENDHDGVSNRVADTAFEPDRGFYDTPFEVIIETATPDATIYYTTDGSDPIDSAGAPTPGAQIYAPDNKPLITTTTCLRAAAVKAGCLSTNIDTHTYIFPSHVLTQPVLPAGYPDRWISGSDIVDGDYQVDPDIVNHTVQLNRLTAERLRAAPTLCVVMNKDDWFKTGHGLYVTESLDGTEYVCSFEYFDPDGDGRSIQQNMAVAMAGGVSGGGTSLNRWKSYKLSMRPRFKTQTDDGTITGGGTKLNERIFLDSPVNNMDTIVLDAVLNNSWTHPSEGQQTNVMLIQDQYVADLHNAMTPANSPHGGHAHMYINGLYWGMYYIHERPDHSWAAETFGGDKDEYDAIKHNSSNVINDGIGGSGATANYNTMLAAASAVDADPTNLSKWLTLEQHLDVDNFIAYLLANWFTGNNDWPSKNWYATHKVGGQWRFHSWDAEHTIYTGDRVGESPSGIHRKLDGCDEYIIRLADHIHKHFHHGGALSYPRTAEMYQARMDSVDQAIRGESARWGDNRVSVPYTYQDWLNNQNSKLTSYFPSRSSTVFGQLGGLYPDTDPPDFRVNGSDMYGGYVSVGDSLAISNPNGDGTVYYTTNGNDPRMSGGAVNSAGGAVTYSSAITIAHTIHLKARVLNDGQWSAMSEAVFAVDTIADSLRITEIMYHPQDPPSPGNYSDGDFEYVELQNISTQPINLNLVEFTNGIEYTFDASVLLGAGEYIVVTSNQNAFADRYDTTNLNIAPGEFTGALDNGGEEIDLKDALGTEIHDFDYDDDWRPHTDGEGFSLTIIDPLNADPNSWDEKDSWRASAYIDGSPGEDDAGILPNPGSIVINELLAHSHDAAPDWIELYNTTDEVINIGGWYLSDGASDLKKYRIADGQTIDAHGYRLFYEDVNFGESSSDPGRLTGFALSENGEQLFLSSAQGSQLLGYREYEDFGASPTGVSFGRYFKASTGNYNFVMQESATPGSANSDPRVGPIVVSEIMYNPAPGYQNLEFIELYNIDDTAVTLFDPVAGLPWKFTSGIDYTFPGDGGLTIPAGGYAVIARDVSAYMTQYGAPSPEVAILGPYAGALDNSGEKLELSLPGDIDGMGTRYYIRVDRVNFSDGSHPGDVPGGIDLWPVEADGAGKSLTRIVPQDYGNDPVNWIAADPSPGQ